MLKTILNKLKRRENLWWAICFFILLLFHFRYTHNSDEGIVLEGAWNIINGKVPYTDFFEFIPPGSFYLVLFVWKIFGVSYFSAKLIGITSVFLSAIGIYKISNQISKSIYNYLPPLFFILTTFCWPLINHNTLNLCVTIWIIHFFLKAISDPLKSKFFIISGMLSGLSILFIQQKGVVTVLTLVFFLLLRCAYTKKIIWLKQSTLFIFFSSILPLSLLIKWNFSTLYYHLVSFPLNNYSEVNKTNLFLFYFFAFLIFMMSILLLKSKNKIIYFLLYLQACLLLTTIPNADLYHLGIVLFPLFSLYPYIHKTLKENKFIHVYYYHFFLYLGLLLILLPSLFWGSYTINYLFLQEQINNSSNKIHDFIDENCPGTHDLYSGPFLPQFYFEFRKINPSGYYTLVTNHQTEAQFQEAYESLKNNPPKCAILNYQMVEKYNYDKNNPVDEFLKTNYNFSFRQGNTSFYTLNTN